MNFEIDVNDLELILFPGRNPPEKFLNQYHQAYECWRAVWEHANQVELNNNEYMPSDNFTRQDEVMGLFYKGECAAVTFLKWIDGNEAPVIHDSYFKLWPEIAFRRLCSNGPNLMVSSQFTVHFNFRKNFLNLPWKDLMMGLIAKRFALSDCDAMAGTTRLAKNVGEVAYRSGATSIIKNMPFYNEEVTVDLVAWYRGIGDSVVPGISPLVNEIYQNHTVALVQPLIFPTTIKEVKRAA